MTAHNIARRCATAALLLGLVRFANADQGQDVAGPNGPITFIAQRAIDFGEVRDGEIATATFTVENRGTADLVIEDVKAACGCTTVKLTDEERVVRPGEKRDVIAHFDTTGRLGMQRSPIVLTLNDPREPQVTLTLIADVVSLFKILPAPLLHLRSAQRGEELPPLEVFPYRAETRFDDFTVDTPGPVLHHQSEPISDAVYGHGIRLVFQVPDDIELGTVAGNVLLHGIVDGEEATLPVRVAGQVVGDLVARPVSLQALTPVARGLKLAPVTIAAANDRPFEVLSVDAGPYIDVAAEPKRLKKEYTVRAVIRDDAPDGPLGTEIVVRTNNTGQPIVRIPVFANVRPRFVLEPDVALLGPAVGNTRLVRIRADRGLMLDVRRASCEHPMIVAAVADESASALDNVGYVRISLREDARLEENISAEVMVETNIPGASVVRIPVEYYVGERNEGVRD
jgi:hypothetical protein